MRGRLFGGIAVLALLPMVAGCVQATRHSNTMIFGTNTSVGLKVGNDVNQIPVILVGYDRQEAVIMPLLANTSEKEGSDNLLTPCNVGEGVTVTAKDGSEGDAPQFAVHPCLFAATNAGATDSYSVLASFGAKFHAEGGTGPKAGGGLAQYFATGLAAQILATTGGAAVISTTAEETSPEAAAAATKLFGTDAQRAQTVQFVSNYQKFKTDLRGRIAADANDDEMFKRLDRFEKSVAAKSKLSTLCKTKVTCLAELDESGNASFANLYRTKGSEMDAELAKWTTPLL